MMELVEIRYGKKCIASSLGAKLLAEFEDTETRKLRIVKERFEQLVIEARLGGEDDGVIEQIYAVLRENGDVCDFLLYC